MVLDNTIEYLRDPADPSHLTEDTRELGLVVCRGPSVELVCPADGMEVMRDFCEVVYSKQASLVCYVYV
ncbi:U6 snRNA associated Sm protein LSm7 [Echinococcus multilocularis]|uniref:U6 snRNA associated Sm protein LSm7 n=1 Tax=Echinococcus multilocularis TaxID=6211 RepID=A0A087VZT2_ECHMU|nr:U6 snRNA associated Sm protein LSm7 [Echinococcus multilocularis]